MTHPLSPTMALPALATLHACAAAGVGKALGTLQDVYFPHTSSSASNDAVPVLKQSLSKAVSALRPTRSMGLIHHDAIPDSGYASAEEDEEEEKEGAKETVGENENDEEGMEEELNLLRSDELERGYAIKWLTGLLKRGDAWVFEAGSCSPLPAEREARAAQLEEASELLARFARNDTTEEALTRTFMFPFRMLSYCRCCFCFADASAEAPPIKVELNDAPVDGTDHTAVGLQSWGSAIVFAEHMCSDPERYLGALHSCPSMPTITTTSQRRFLELGAGTGLLSIVAAQILSRTSIQAKIKATDYHPSVLENLAQNVHHNHDPSTVGISLSVGKLDWCAVASVKCVGVDVDGDEDENEDGAEADAYDVVLAADVVYHPEHAHWIRGCVERMMKEDGVFWLMIPVRTIGRHEGLEGTVEKSFPIANGEMDGVDSDPEGKRLAIVGREDVERVNGVGRADEAGYRLFEIRWV